MQSIVLTIPPNINVFSDDKLYASCLANPELRIERDETGHIIILPPFDCLRRKLFLRHSLVKMY